MRATIAAALGFLVGCAAPGPATTERVEASPPEANAPAASPPEARPRDSAPAGALLREVDAPVPPRNTYQLDLVDLDGDGRSELIRTNTQQPVEILRWADGWTAVAALPGLGPHQGAAALDLTGDGRPEIAVAVAGGASRVHRNAEGWPVLWRGPDDGVAKDVAAVRMGGAAPRFEFVGPRGAGSVAGPDAVARPRFAGQEVDAIAPIPGPDTTDHMRLHYAVSGAAPAPDHQVALLGDPDPPAARAVDTPTSDAAVGRVGGRRLLALANPDGPDAVVDAVTLEPVWTHPASMHRREVAWGDLDGDGDDDLVLAGEGGLEVWALNPPRRLWSVDDEHLREGLAVGDVDGDGLLDVVIGGRDAEREPTLAPGEPGGLGLRTFLGTR